VWRTCWHVCDSIRCGISERSYPLPNEFTNCIHFVKWCCVARDHQSTWVATATHILRQIVQTSVHVHIFPDFILHAYLSNSGCWKYPHRATRMCQQLLRFQEPRWVRRSVESVVLLADPLCALSGTICPLGGTHRVILLPCRMWLPSMEGICLYIIYVLL